MNVEIAYFSAFCKLKWSHLQCRQGTIRHYIITTICPSSWNNSSSAASSSPPGHKKGVFRPWDFFLLSACYSELYWCMPSENWRKPRVPLGYGKSWNLGRPFSRPGTSWKIAKVMESHEKSWKMIIMSCNFYRSCRCSRIANELVLDCCDICKYV